MKKLLSLLMCTTVLVSSISLTPCFAEGSDVEELSTLGERSGEQVVKDAGWDVTSYANAESYNYALKFAAGGMSMTYGGQTGHEINGIADDKSLTISMDIAQHNAVSGGSLFEVKFTDENSKSMYVSFGLTGSDEAKDIYVLNNDCSYSASNAVGTVGFIGGANFETLRIRLKAATNTIDIFKGNDVLVNNIAASATSDKFFDASKLKTINLASRSGDGTKRITMAKNIKITKEPNSEKRPSLSTVYTNDFEGLGANQLPVGFSNVSIQQSKGVSAETVDPEHGTSMKISTVIGNTGACLVFDQPITSGEVVVEWDEYVGDNTSAKPKMYIYSNGQSHSASKILNGLGTGQYDMVNLKAAQWTRVIYKINFAAKQIRLKYGEQDTRVYDMADSDAILTNGLESLMFANSGSTPVYYDNLKIELVNTAAPAEFKVTSVDSTDIANGKVTIGYTNTTANTETGKAIAAYYDSDNRFISCELKDVDFTIGGTSADVGFTPVKTSTYETVKVFLWNDLSAMKPLF